MNTKTYQKNSFSFVSVGTKVCRTKFLIWF